MTGNDSLPYLIKYLLSERPDLGSADIPCGKEERFRLFRSLVNIRPPKPVSSEFLRVQDEFLHEELLSRGITDVSLGKQYKKRCVLLHIDGSFRLSAKGCRGDRRFRGKKFYQGS